MVDNDKIMRQLADGFAALEDQYKTLALQHDAIKRQLAAVNDQHESLKRLVPDGRLPSDLTFPPDSTVSLSTVSSRTAVDWISDTQADALDIQGSISKIRDAAFAAFKVRERANGKPVTGRDTMSKSSSRRATSDLERDYTTERTKGTLGCPFASTSSPRQSVRGTRTPRTLGSHASFSERRTHRTSFNDPIKPELENIDEESQGPACPIRFLDKHSPEDIARYFEEHKHELPRSHEFCVKMHQTDAESIRALDQKYGNLVAMIQGLGQKHKPMLPEQEEEGYAGDDAKSNARVHDWARAVSEGGLDVPVQALIGSRSDAGNPGTADTRLARFDRPLKEIRVGESPSRPWGVPIPSRYYEAAERETAGETEHVELQDASAAQPVSTEGLPKPTPARPLRPADDIENIQHNAIKALAAHGGRVDEVRRASVDEVRRASVATAGPLATPPAPAATAAAAPSRPKGKCPFGHAPVPVPAGHAKEMAPAHTLKAPAAVPAAVPALTVPAHAEALPAGPTATSPLSPPPHIVNHGLVVARDAGSFKGARLENRGTLVLGYGSEAAAVLQGLGVPLPA